MLRRGVAASVLALCGSVFVPLSGGAPAEAADVQSQGQVKGVIRGGVFQDTADGNGDTNPLRFEVGDIGGSVLTGGLYWTSTTIPTDGTRSKIELVPIGAGTSNVVISSEYHIAYNGLYYHRAGIPKAALQTNQTYAISGLAQGAMVNAFVVVDGADAPQTFVNIFPQMGDYPTYSSSGAPMANLPAAPPYNGVGLFAGMRKVTTPQTATWVDKGGILSKSPEITAANFTTAFPVTRSDTNTYDGEARIKWSSATEEMFFLYTGYTSDAPFPEMSSSTKFVKRGTYEEVTSAYPGEELDILATIRNRPTATDTAASAQNYIYPLPTSFTYNLSGATVDPSTSDDVVMSSEDPRVATNITPGSQFVKRIPITVRNISGSSGTTELHVSMYNHWSHRFESGLIITEATADLLPSAAGALAITHQDEPTPPANGFANVLYIVNLSNFNGPDPVTSGTVSVTPPGGAQLVSVETAGPIACQTYTCNTTGSIPVGTSASAYYTIRVPLHVDNVMSATATYSPNRTSEVLTAEDHVFFGDYSAPTVALAAPTTPFTGSSSATVRWTGTDSGGSEIAKFEVQQRRANTAGTWSAWATSTHAPNVVSKSVALSQGYDYCFRVRGIDGSGNTSAWSAPRCTARYLDDRALAATSSWRRITSSARLYGTATVATAKNATLTKPGVKGRRFTAVVTKCPTCGTANVYIGTKLIGTLRLYSSTTRLRQAVSFPLQSTAIYGTLKIVVTSSTKRVELDGFGAAQQ